MEHQFVDGEFWLPSDFLVDEILTEKHRSEEDDCCRKVSPRTEFPNQFGSVRSGFNSPVESVFGSTETESDEEEYMAGLTRKMAHWTLDEDGKYAPVFDEEKAKMVVAGSPQSPLCATGTWKSGSQGSSRNSPTGPSQASSPTSMADGAWDLLYAAAGQVARMKTNDELPRHTGRGLLGLPKKPAKPASTGYFLNHAVPPQLQNNQCHRVKQQVKQQPPSQWVRPCKSHSVTTQHVPSVAGRAKSGGGVYNGRNWRSVGYSSSCWPALNSHPQPCSGMRAVFLGDPGSRRECNGTGVFLPRVGNSTDQKRKPACSTVLIPARVVQALNLNLDDLGTAQPRFQPNSVQQDDFTDRSRRDGSVAPLLQNRYSSLFSEPCTTHDQDICLPAEWTY